jgi:hypothetical protein
VGSSPLLLLGEKEKLIVLSCAEFFFFVAKNYKKNTREIHGDSEAVSAGRFYLSGSSRRFAALHRRHKCTINGLLHPQRNTALWKRSPLWKRSQGAVRDTTHSSPYLPTMEMLHKNLGDGFGCGAIVTRKHHQPHATCPKKHFQGRDANNLMVSL